MIDYSKTLKTKFKKYLLTAEELAFADLVLSDYTAEDAYQIIYRPSTLTPGQIRASARKLLSNDRVSQYITAMKDLAFKSTPEAQTKPSLE